MPNLTLAGIWLGLLASIAIHESGHALTALITGTKIEKITVGFSKIFSFKIGGIPVEIGLIPLIGSVRLAPGVFWLKRMFITLAGPLTSFCFSMTCYYILGGSAYIHTLANDHFLISGILKGIFDSHTSALPNPEAFSTFINGGVTLALVFMANINLALAICNSLPFPPLDGGNFLFAILEGIFGEKVKELYGKLSMVTIVLILILNIYIAFKK